jgi:hypothetical protein
LNLLGQLNTYFGVSNINYIRNTMANYQGWPLANGTYAFAGTVGISISSSSGDTNWRKWLKHLDNHVNAKATIAGELCATTVGNAISKGLDMNNGYQAIEFFAIPDKGSTHHISVETVDITDVNKNKTLIINIYTVTFDKLNP